MLFATGLVLASASLHAAWNLLIKTSDDRDLAALGQFAAGGLLFLPLLLVIGPPGSDTWALLAVSGVVHVAYVGALTTAYRHGDFSLAYPLARGTGAAAAALGGAWLLGDGLPVPGWVALAVVVGGLASFAGRAASAPSVGWAMATGVAIGTYTVVDTVGARRSDGLAYTVALVLVVAVALGATTVVRGRRRDFVASLRGAWRRYLLSGALLTTAYGLVLVAVRHAPIGYVATLRESGVVIGALAGWLVLDEPMAPRRVVSSSIVAVGLIALVAAR